MLLGAVLEGKRAIEHVDEDDRGQKHTGIFHLTLEIGLRVVIYPNSTSRLGSWCRAKCCLINTVNSTASRLWEMSSGHLLCACATEGTLVSKEHELRHCIIPKGCVDSINLDRALGWRKFRMIAEA